MLKTVEHPTTEIVILRIRTNGTLDAVYYTDWATSTFSLSSANYQSDHWIFIG